jgi:hypothetical protein
MAVVLAHVNRAALSQALESGGQFLISVNSGWSESFLPKKQSKEQAAFQA